MIRKTIANSSGRSRFQIVDQGGDIEGRMDLRQKMDMIRFASELQKRASPIRQDLAKGIMQIVKQFRREGFSPVLCHKNDM